MRITVFSYVPGAETDTGPSVRYVRCRIQSMCLVCRLRRTQAERDTHTSRCRFQSMCSVCVRVCMCVCVGACVCVSECVCVCMCVCV